MFQCSSCDFSCSRQSNYDNHLLKSKHINKLNLNDEDSTATPVVSKKQYQCEKCDKVYFARNSLWYHKKNVIPTKSKTRRIQLVRMLRMTQLLHLSKKLQFWKKYFWCFLWKMREMISILTRKRTFPISSNEILHVENIA